MPQLFWAHSTAQETEELSGILGLLKRRRRKIRGALAPQDEVLRSDKRISLLLHRGDDVLCSTYRKPQRLGFFRMGRASSQRYAVSRFSNSQDVSMRAIAARADAARWLGADAPMHEIACFQATCPTCRKQREQRNHTRANLLRLLDADFRIEAYCTDCREFWAISPRERAMLAQQLSDD